MGPPGESSVPSPTTEIPRGHWTLYDAQGNAVEAIVSPWCSLAAPCTDYASFNGRCVYVDYFGPERVREPYELETGLSMNCFDSSGLDRGRWRPLPPRIATLLSNAPYTLVLEYY